MAADELDERDPGTELKGTVSLNMLWAISKRTRSALRTFA
jgi:hypothetical protein